MQRTCAVSVYFTQECEFAQLTHHVSGLHACCAFCTAIIKAACDSLGYWRTAWVCMNTGMIKPSMRMPVLGIDTLIELKLGHYDSDTIRSMCMQLTFNGEKFDAVMEDNWVSDTLMQMMMVHLRQHCAVVIMQECGDVATEPALVDIICDYARPSATFGCSFDHFARSTVGFVSLNR